VVAAQITNARRTPGIDRKECGIRVKGRQGGGLLARSQPASADGFSYIRESADNPSQWSNRADKSQFQAGEWPREECFGTR